MKKLDLAVIFLFVSFSFFNFSYGQELEFSITSIIESRALESPLEIESMRSGIVKNSFDQDKNIKKIKSFNNSLDIRLELSGLKIDNYHQIKAKEVVGITNTGDTLRDDSYDKTVEFKTENTINLRLQNSKREAKKIEKITGVLEYYTIPESKKELIIKINNPLGKFHQNLLEEHSKDYKIILINGKKILSLKEKSSSSYKKEIERLSEELFIKGGKTKPEIIKDIKSYFDSLLSLVYEEDNLLFYINYLEDKNSISNIQVYDEFEEIISSLVGGGLKNKVTVYLTEKLKKGSTIVFTMKAPKYIKEIPFEIKDVPLP